MNEPTRVKLEIFIPPEFVDPLLETLTETGAGRIGNYDHCCSLSPVTGTWRPLPGANPYNGEIGKICTDSEMRVEMNCSIAVLPAALAAIRRIHPYEEPVVNIIPLLAVRT
jgi:hypothetical protein